VSTRAAMFVFGRPAEQERRMCVPECGKEFRTGEFPGKFQTNRRELQITGASTEFGAY